MLRKIPLVLGLIATGFTLVAGCATSFTGDAKFPGGGAGCHSRCLKNNMEMDSFVYMGEYSTACVCRLRGGDSSVRASAAGAGGAVGVVMQMRAQEAAASGGAVGGAAAGAY